MNSWSSNEVNKLARYYGNSSNQAIANYLGRTTIAVRRKANREGLRKFMGASRNPHVVISTSGRRRHV